MPDSLQSLHIMKHGKHPVRGSFALEEKNKKSKTMAIITALYSHGEWKSIMLNLVVDGLEEKSTRNQRLQ